MACLLFVLSTVLGFSAAARGMDPEIASDRVWARHFWHWYDTGEVSVAAINLKLMVGDVAIDDPLTPSLVLFEELVQHSVDGEYSITPADLDDPLANDIIRFHSLTGWLAAPTDSPLALGLIAMSLSGEGEVTTSSDGAYAGLKSNGPQTGIVPPSFAESGSDVPEMYRDFWQDLNDAVEASQLADLVFPDGTPFYIPDPSIGAGFECEDYAKAMECYLEHTLQDEHPEMVVDFLTMQFVDSDGIEQDHAMVYVEYDGVLYVNDPQTGRIRGPLVGNAEITAAVKGILVLEYKLPADGGIDLQKASNNAVDAGAGPYFYTDPTIMEQFEAALLQQGVTDSAPYVPDDYMP